MRDGGMGTTASLRFPDPSVPHPSTNRKVGLESAFFVRYAPPANTPIAPLKGDWLSPSLMRGTV